MKIIKILYASVITAIYFMSSAIIMKGLGVLYSLTPGVLFMAAFGILCALFIALSAIYIIRYDKEESPSPSPLLYIFQFRINRYETMDKRTGKIYAERNAYPHRIAYIALFFSMFLFEAVPLFIYLKSPVFQNSPDRASLLVLCAGAEFALFAVYALLLFPGMIYGISRFETIEKEAGA